MKTQSRKVDFNPGGWTTIEVGEKRYEFKKSPSNFRFVDTVAKFIDFNERHGLTRTRKKCGICGNLWTTINGDDGVYLIFTNHENIIACQDCKEKVHPTAEAAQASLEENDDNQ